MECFGANESVVRSQPDRWHRPASADFFGIYFTFHYCLPNLTPSNVALP